MFILVNVSHSQIMIIFGKKEFLTEEIIQLFFLYIYPPFDKNVNRVTHEIAAEVALVTLK